ncbi:glutamate--tRNA ligase [Persicobacter diffluens]|uniref:Glutamate--tRNA ligase n=1 Tax=Persicobacter diffluens TaxID=981 RepID=A0AAN4VTM9_9BACT|nr:glutamate--tRNA ligase [Persicobacter diffluens]
MEKEVRVRFAPSPTGALHIGGVRTALFNYLFARKHGGKFLLRLEDTDQSRFVEGAEAYILEALNWMGIQVDEGVGAEGGECGPYVQSQRKDIYQKYVQQLIDEDKAYYAFDTPEELDAMRERLMEAKVAQPQYNSITRMQMKNSLTLSAEEVKTKMDAGEPYVVRLKVPRKEEIRLNDMVRGWVKVMSIDVDDKVLLKSDGMPTYHLANVVDDHLMGITHVIRGEEWLPSAPCHVLLYDFLGWEDSMPQFAHLPLILKPDGNGKLSKRDADKKGYPVFPLDWNDPRTGEFSIGFREQGYLPETMVNFLAMLGWSPGNDEEMFTMEELCERFSIERVGKAGTKFDIQKAQWYNQQYLKNRPEADITAFVLADAQKAGYECSEEKARAIGQLMKERVTYPTQFASEGKYFFVAPEEYDDKVIRKKWTQEAVEVIGAFKNAMVAVEDFSAENIKAAYIGVCEAREIGMGKVMQSLRVSVTGQGGGADLFETIATIGKEEVSNRIEAAINTLADRVKA